jgi:hypothetical protein
VSKSATWRGYHASLPLGSADRATVRWGDALVVFMLLGYLTMRKSFAYLGVPPLYIGELGLATFLLAYPGSIVRHWLSSLYRRQTLSPVAWSLYIFAAYGAAQFIRGLSSGHQLKIVVEEMVFYAYPLFLFVGAWAGIRHPHLLQKTLRVLAWVCGIYGLAFVAYFGRTQGPWFDEQVVPIFGQPAGAGVALLGLVAFQPQVLRVIVPLVLNAVVLLGMGERSGWLGFLTGLSIWGVLSGKVLQMIKAMAAIAALVALGLFTSFANPTQSDYFAYSLSARDVVGSAVAPFSPELAAKLSDNAGTYTATVSWRTQWWQEIWKQVHATRVQAIFGLGFGYPIWDLHPEELTRIIRTPHNATMFALAYSGWLGLGLFYAFQLSLAALLWKVYRLTGQPFGLCFWLMAMVQAQFDSYFEAPFGAIPFYLLVGLSIAPLMIAAPPADRSVGN